MPVEQSEIVFQRNDLRVAARVAWVKGHQAGIAFANPLSTQEVLRNVPQPKARVQSEYRRPGFSPRALPRQEQAAMDYLMKLMVKGS